MAFNEFLAERVRTLLTMKSKSFTEVKMMGGLAITIDNKMCLGVIHDNLMCRIDPAIQNEVLRRKGCREMDFTHRPMKGYLYVDAEGYDMDSDLESWVDLALEFNPRAKSSKK